MKSSTKGALFCGAVALAAMSNTFCVKRPEVVPGIPVTQLQGHGSIAQDTAPKEELRMVPAEAYMRTYLQLFGGLAPLDVQKKARGGDGAQLFDTWDDYLAALGFPDYRNDIPRGAQTNALMVATFERLGAALCDRAVEHDLGTDKKPGAKLAERIIFAFEETKGDPDVKSFADRFDVLHRTFLGYPAALAETDRTNRFYKLYMDTVARHRKNPVKTKLNPEQAGWAVVCEGLIRHPEFQLY